MEIQSDCERDPFWFNQINSSCKHLFKKGIILIGTVPVPEVHISIEPEASAIELDDHTLNDSSRNLIKIFLSPTVQNILIFTKLYK